VDETFETRDGRESEAIRHLRNNSRYLLNGGAWGRVRIFGLLITGILTNLLLVLPVPLVAVLALLGLKQLGYWGETWPPSFGAAMDAPPFSVFVGFSLLLGIAWLALPLMRNQSRGAEPDSMRSRIRVFWETVTLVLVSSPFSPLCWRCCRQSLTS
jgi:hypothetical protein